jgi:hypothetical protein
LPIIIDEKDWSKQDIDEYYGYLQSDVDELGDRLAKFLILLRIGGISLLIALCRDDYICRLYDGLSQKQTCDFVRCAGDLMRYIS